MGLGMTKQTQALLYSTYKNTMKLECGMSEAGNTSDPRLMDYRKYQ